MKRRKKIGEVKSGVPVHCKYDELVDVRTLKPNPKNPNTHTEEQIKLLAKIIEHNGWRDKVVVSNRSGMVVRGHGRIQAAKRLEQQKVPVEYQDYDDEAAEIRDLIADNKISEFSFINKDKAMELLSEIEGIEVDEELSNIGFDEDEIKKMFDFVSDDYVENNAPDNSTQKKENNAILKIEVPGGVWFDSKDKIIERLEEFCENYGLLLEVPKEPQKQKKSRF